MRVAVPLEKSYRLINHGPVVLVSARFGGQANVMAAAWCMALDFAPPKLAVVVAADTHTRGLIEQSGQLAINVPCRAQVDVVEAVGSCSGAVVDKFDKFAIGSCAGDVVDAPLVDGCNAWLECKLIPGEEGVRERYDLLLCEVVAAWADDVVYSAARFRDDVPPERRSLHHVAGGFYVADGEVVRPRAVAPAP